MNNVLEHTHDMGAYVFQSPEVEKSGDLDEKKYFPDLEKSEF